MVMKRPRCLGLETRDWKAVWSSWDAVDIVIIIVSIGTCLHDIAG
jgi:hypothetical protein